MSDFCSYCVFFHFLDSSGKFQHTKVNTHVKEDIFQPKDGSESMVIQEIDDGKPAEAIYYLASDDSMKKEKSDPNMDQKPSPRLQSPPPQPLTGGQLPSDRSRFGKDAATELMYDNFRQNTFHSLAIENDTIKSTSIWSRHGKQVNLAFDTSDLFEKTLATGDFQCVTKSVPLSMFTHLESHAQGTHIVQFGTRVMHFLTEKTAPVVTFLQRSLVYVALLMFLVVVAVSFYIPGSNDTATRGADRGQLSMQLTLIMMVFCAATWIAHIVLTRLHYRSSTYSGTVWTFLSIAFVALCVCLSLSIVVFTLTQPQLHRTNHNSGGSGNNSSLVTKIYKSDAMQGFMCGCPHFPPNNTHHNTSEPTLMPTYIPTTLTPLAVSQNPTVTPTTVSPSVAPTSQAPAVPTVTPSFRPTTNPTYHHTPAPTATPDAYAFQCTADNYKAADFESCKMNCGVCGSEYRKPFIAFASFAGLYILIMLYLSFYQYFMVYLVEDVMWVLVVPPALPPVNSLTHMVVTIHGSEAFGYPLVTRLALEDTLKLNKLLSLYAEQEGEKRSGMWCCVMHMLCDVSCTLF